MLVCGQCGNQVADGFRFCGICGTPLTEQAAPPPAPAPAPVEAQPAEVVAPPARQTQAQLVLVKGEGFSGISYRLLAEQHKMGRLNGTILFPDDIYLSNLHANLYYEGEELYIKDEGSINGVFIKLKEPVELQDGDHFLVGEELVRFEKMTGYSPYVEITAQEGDDAEFYGCPPEKKVHFRLTHLFRDGQEGAVHYASSASVRLGREHCDISFPFDRHISGRHARVYEENGRYFLQDLGSKNGTFLRISEPLRLLDGDYFFAGQQLFRVELSVS